MYKTIHVRGVGRSPEVVRQCESCACAVVIYCVSEDVAPRDDELHALYIDVAVGDQICSLLEMDFRLEIMLYYPK